MSVFDGFYGLLSRCPEKGLFKLPATTQDELLGALLLLPSAETSIRAPVCSTFFATDSTPSTGGSCRADTSQGIAEFLYQSAETKGDYVRLDWNPLELELVPCKMMPAGSAMEELVQELQWGKPASFKHRRLRHISLQETEAVVIECTSRQSKHEAYLFQ